METKNYIKLKNKPQDNIPQWLIVHHSGGTDANQLADTSNHTANDMEAWHLSKGWEGLGYHYVIEKDGELWQGRPELYHGSHCVGYNQKSLGICLSGNFDATLPTFQQIATLKTLLKEKMAKYNIPLENIVPHRKFANKSCYGKLLSDSWARDLVAVAPNNKEAIKNQIIELLKLL